MLETFSINNITFTRMNTMKKKMAQIQKQKIFTRKSLDLLMSITSSLKKNSKLVKSLIKNNHLKNQQKMIGVNLMNGGKKI